MKTRLTKSVTIPATREEAEAIVGQIAIFTVRLRRLQNDKDSQIASIVERFQPAISGVEAALQADTDLLLAWAQANPEEFPKGHKSIKFSLGTIGFRTGMPKLSLLNRKWNWDKALEYVQQLLPNFVRSVPQIDKEALIAQSDEKTIARTLPACGLKVVQAESFYVDPDLTEMEARLVASPDVA